MSHPRKGRLPPLFAVLIFDTETGFCLLESRNTWTKADIGLGALSKMVFSFVQLARTVEGGHIHRVVFDPEGEAPPPLRASGRDKRQIEMTVVSGRLVRIAAFSSPHRVRKRVAHQPGGAAAASSTRPQTLEDGADSARAPVSSTGSGPALPRLHPASVLENALGDLLSRFESEHGHAVTGEARGRWRGMIELDADDAAREAEVAVFAGFEDTVSEVVGELAIRASRSSGAPRRADGGTDAGGDGTGVMSENDDHE